MCETVRESREKNLLSVDLLDGDKASQSSFWSVVNGSTKQMQLYKESFRGYRKMQSKTANDRVQNTTNGFVF